MQADHCEPTTASRPLQANGSAQAPMKQPPESTQRRVSSSERAPMGTHPMEHAGPAHRSLARFIARWSGVSLARCLSLPNLAGQSWRCRSNDPHTFDVAGVVVQARWTTPKRGGGAVSLRRLAQSRLAHSRLSVAQAQPGGGVPWGCCSRPPRPAISSIHLAQPSHSAVSLSCLAHPSRTARLAPAA